MIYANANVLADSVVTDVDTVQKTEIKKDSTINRKVVSMAVADSLDEKNKKPGGDVLEDGEFDAIRYSLDTRYIEYGDHFTKKWHDHLFLEFGAGVEQIVPTVDYYKFNPLTTAHIGVGKQFNRLSSLRLLFEGAFGYQQQKDNLFVRWGAKADYLYSITSHLNGYVPERKLDISAVMSMGLMNSKMNGGKEGSNSIEFHGGLQFRFFTGPQGYLNFEPYFGIQHDNGDLSGSSNWRKYDVFYGANVNFIYYIHNNLSKEARRRFIQNKWISPDNHLAADSLSYQSWQSPWFVEMSTGAAFTRYDGLGYKDNLGPKMEVSAGKWFSSAIGLRLSATTSTTKWDKYRVKSTSSDKIRYTANDYALHFGLRAEAMINPLGFTNNYSWDSRFGVNLLGGVEIGWINKTGKNNNRTLSCRSLTYTAGMQLWARLSDGLRLFVEPRYSYAEYQIPYSNVDWYERYADHIYNLNVGMTVMMKDQKYRRSLSDVNAEPKQWSVGLAAGVPFLSKTRSYDGDGNFNWNATVHAQYRFTDIHSARLGFTYASVGDNMLSGYKYFKPESPEYAVSGRGLWNRKFHVGLVSAAYSVNMTNLFCDIDKGRRWNMELFAGPALTFTMGETSELSSMERHLTGYKYVIDSKVDSGAFFGVHGGMHLSYDINSNVSAFLSPSFYLFKEAALPGNMIRSVVLIETVNLGVQYNF